MRILAYKTQVNGNKLVLIESTGEYVHTNNLAELLSFLLEPYEQTIRICWELDATVAPILRLLGERRCKRLYREHKCTLWPEDPAASIFYIPSKVFSIEGIIKHEGKYMRNRANLYDLAQYYPELDEPEDLTEVQQLGEKLMYELKKMGLEPTKLTSPVAIYEQCVMSKLDLPKLIDVPKEVAEFAYRCSGRLWIEAHQIGHWE